MESLTLLDGLAAASPAEKGAGIVVEFGRMGIHCRGRSTALRGKQGEGVVGPASGEVYALGAVGAGLVLALQEHHLVSVIELRDAAHGCKQRQGQFHALGVLLEGIARTGMVVVCEEG